MLHDAYCDVSTCLDGFGNPTIADALSQMNA